MTVLVAKLHRDLAQRAKGFGVFIAQRPGDGETIDKNTLATVGVVHQAMQKLQPWLQLASGQVAVQRQVESGVGVAVGIGLGLHVEQHAEVALADERNALGDQCQGAGFCGHAAHLRKAAVTQGQQPVQQGFRVFHQCCVVEYGQLETTVPQFGFRLGRPAFSAGLIVVGVRPQPAGIVLAVMPATPFNRQ